MPVRNNRCFGEIAADKNSGKLKKADYDRTIRIAKEAIAREGKIRGLIIAEAFEGWERKEDWDDVSFMMEERSGQRSKVTPPRISPHRHRVPASRMNEARIWLSS